MNRRPKNIKMQRDCPASPRKKHKFQCFFSTSFLKCQVLWRATPQVESTWKKRDYPLKQGKQKT